MDGDCGFDHRGRRVRCSTLAKNKKFVDRSKKAALASIDNLEGVLIHNHVEPAMRNHLLKNLRMYYEDPFHHLE